MSQFTVRIELHNANAEDYNKLHKAMEADGFSRTITANDGTVYHLPTAEYDFEHASMSSGDVRDKAGAVAKKIKSDPAVLVTKSAGRAWRGLDEA